MREIHMQPLQPQLGDNVFVGSLPYEWAEADINMLCGQYGTIVSSLVLRDKATGQSRGAAMVRFSSPSEAAYVVQALNGFAIDGTTRCLEVKLAERPEEKGARKALKQVAQQLRFAPYARPGAPVLPGPLGLPGTMAMGFGEGRTLLGGIIAPIVVPKRLDIQPEEGTNLHVFGLDTRVTDIHLFQAFAPYGAIRSVRVIHDKATGNPKGYGFVQFYHQQDAQSALMALNGVQVGQRTWKVSFHQGKTPA
eukprot:GGOE01053428.1.p1 GENE.GGOE01053428.1~~GGOE01053428.1.p1  ORF type:complete len:250 (+),score=66.56 GGOE01053428.1:587-1336(+)